MSQYTIACNELEELNKGGREKLKIAYDAQLLLDDKMTGIGWLAHNVVSAMIRVRPQNEYTLDFFLLSKQIKKNKKIIKKYRLAGFAIDGCNWFNYTLYKIIWPFIPIRYSSFFRRREDITMFFNYYIPPGVNGKKITMIHDMTYKVFPETLNKKTLYMLNMNMKKSCKRADKIITISEFSKREIVKYMGVDENIIEVMPIGIEHNLFKTYEDKQQIQKVLKKYGIMEEYFLYLGTLEPRKNIERMLQAYLKLKKENDNCPKFVISGRKGWMYDSIYGFVKQNNMEDSIIFTGYVEEYEVPLLMNGAIAFLFVSLYEGFGMPLLEAMACGTAVITSNVSSMPEVVGDSAIMVNPYSIEEIFAAMKVLCQNKIYRNKYVERGIKRANEFTWDKSAYFIFDVMERILYS